MSSVAGVAGAVRRVLAAVPILLLATLVPSPASLSAPGDAAFEALAGVFLHPRCTNCHAGGARPFWTDRVHPMNVRGGKKGTGIGQPCDSCHREGNPSIAHGPPGAPKWRMAPAAVMGFRGSTPAELCRHLKDPERTGGLNLVKIVEHIGHDPLVAWSWAPGPGRERAPGSLEQTIEHMESWIAAGAPCPS